MINLDVRLEHCSGDRMKPFKGGNLFARDFRHLEPCGAKPEQLLFSRKSSHVWCNLLSAVMILMATFVSKKIHNTDSYYNVCGLVIFSANDCKWLNKRVIGSKQVPVLPDEFRGLDAGLVCPKSKERNAISAGKFKRYVLDTHVSVRGLGDPQKYTLIVEANIKSSNNTNNGPKQHHIGGAFKAHNSHDIW